MVEGGLALFIGDRGGDGDAEVVIWIVGDDHGAAIADLSVEDFWEDGVRVGGRLM